MSSNSKKLTWLLRHGAAEANIPFDSMGWVEVVDVLSYLRMSHEELKEIVAADNKSRFQLHGDKIRAAQGHSILNAYDLEKSWEEYTSDSPVWHGTNFEALKSIKQQGLLPGDRTHVHMAETTDSKVGKRANVAVMLKIDPSLMRKQGLKLFKSSNGVILARSVPADCIVEIVPRAHGVTRVKT